VGNDLCLVVRTGRIDYLVAWELQKQLVQARASGAVADMLLLVEHPPTYTTGRGGDDRNALFDEETLRRLGAVFYHSDRGGDITFHGPGQLVAYPIIDLKGWNRDVHAYCRSLEAVIISTLADFGISGGRIQGATGVWVGSEKIAAIGVRVSRWVTSHGFALNVEPDLSYFRHIIPCGIRDKGITSMARLLETSVDREAVTRSVVQHFAQEFRRDPTEVTPPELISLAGIRDEEVAGQVNIWY